MAKKVYCTECKKWLPYVVGTCLSEAIFTHNEQKRSVLVEIYVAHCCRCFSEVYVPELEDQNAELRKEAVSRYKQAF